MPKKSRTGLVLGLVAVAAVAVAGTGVLIWQPWASDATGGPHTETAMLGHDIALTVELPEGWKLASGSISGEKSTMVLPDSEHRSVDQVDSDGRSINSGGTGEQIHAILAQSGTCPESEAGLEIGAWSQDSSTSSAHGRAQRRGGTTRVDGNYCVRVIGIDFAHSSQTLDTGASDLLPTLINTDKITAARAA